MSVPHLSTGRGAAGAHRYTQNSPHGLSTHLTPMHRTTVSYNHSHPISHKESFAKSMPQGPQKDSSTQMHSHLGSSHRTTTMQETATGPQLQRRQSHNHSHLGPWPHVNDHTHHSHLDRPRVTQRPETWTGPQSQKEDLSDPRTTQAHTEAH